MANSFNEYMAEQAKENQKAIFNALFFRLEELAYDIVSGRNKTIRMENFDKLAKAMEELNADLNRMVDEKF